MLEKFGDQLFVAECGIFCRKIQNYIYLYIDIIFTACIVYLIYS